MCNHKEQSFERVLVVSVVGLFRRLGASVAAMNGTGVRKSLPSLICITLSLSSDAVHVLAHQIVRDQ